MLSTGTEQSNSSPSVTQIVSGIVGDVQDLGAQHLALFRSEIQHDIRHLTDAAVSLMIGVTIAQIGGLALGLMFVHLLAQFAPNLPLWSCYGIVGATIASLGAIGVWFGIKKLQKIESHSREATRVVQEDVEWLTNPK